MSDSATTPNQRNNSAKVSRKYTRKMVDLMVAGFTEDQIKAITPQEARIALGGMPEQDSQQEENNPLLHAALEHAKFGRSVFPCKSDKTPITPRGFEDSTTDPATICDWWRRWPDALIGIPCKGNRFFTLDVDMKNGIDGKARWVDLIVEKNYLPIQYGPAQYTPSGGMHLLFKYPADVEVPNIAGKLGKGLNLLSTGYICTGPSYTWIPGHGPDTPLTDAPGWLVGVIRKLSVRPPAFPKITRPHVTIPGPSKKDENQTANLPPKYKKGDLVIPYGTDGTQLSDAKKIEVIFPPDPLVSDEYYYRLAGETTGRPQSQLKMKPPEPEEPQMPPIKGTTGQRPAPRKTSWNMSDLLSTDFPEPKWAIPGLVPVGLTFLAGRPKIGKSWLALQFAHAVGTGGHALGEMVQKGKVLFLALEDSPRRLKARAIKQGIPITAEIIFKTEWKPLTKGGMADLEAEIRQGHYSHVVIDTISRALGRADQMDLGEMTSIMGQLQYLAMTLDISILLIDHHTKSKGFEGDPIDDIMGSTGKAAVADSAIGLYKQQGIKGATLKARGRDMEDKELALEWDGLTCCWQNLGNAGDVREDTLKGEIIQAIRNLKEDGELGTTRNIAKQIDKAESSVNRALSDLLSAGKVRHGAPQGKAKPYEEVC